MALVRPRLTDHHDLPLAQEAVDFEIPFLDEDIPLSVDPFLLWKSPSMQDNALHTGLVNAFNHLGYLAARGRDDEAVDMLLRASECDEVGLGFSRSRVGHRLGPAAAGQVLSLFRQIPQIHESGFVHIEEAQLYVGEVGRDRISDIACSFLKSFLIDFTIDQCNQHGIPTADTTVANVYDLKSNAFADSEAVKLPVNPDTGAAVILVPKRWLRRATWINCDDYIQRYYRKHVLPPGAAPPPRPAILNFNRRNYGVVRAYVAEKERTQADCANDPLFSPIPVRSARRKLSFIRDLPPGGSDGANEQYEQVASQLLASLLYPHLDFAAEQVRTDSGAQIRDLVFYNTRSVDFLQDIHRDYDSRQLVFEFKNVRDIAGRHVNQLNRYLTHEFGRFGVLVTRNRLPLAMLQNTVDLWAGQRRCILALADQDLELMTTLFESRQRRPIDVLKARYIQFTRACPA